jgi:hypothetical protein
MRLLPYDHPVPVRDGSVDHRVAGHPEQEQRALTDELPGQGKDILDLLLREDGATGLDPAHQRNVGRLLRRDVRVIAGQVPVVVGTDRRLAGQPDLHGPRPAAIAAQVALPLQGGELVGDARRAGQPDSIANLDHGRRVAALLHRIPDDPEYLALTPGENVVRVGLVGRFRNHDGHAALRLAARSPLNPGRSRHACAACRHFERWGIHDLSIKLPADIP